MVMLLGFWVRRVHVGPPSIGKRVVIRNDGRGGDFIGMSKWPFGVRHYIIGDLVDFFLERPPGDCHRVIEEVRRTSDFIGYFSVFIMTIDGLRK